MTRLGTSWLGTKFRFDAPGRVVLVVSRAPRPAPLPSVTLSLTTTAPTPLAGTPPRPATCTSMVWPAVTAELNPSSVGLKPGRLSRIRAGVRAVYAVLLVGNQPMTSRITWVDPVVVPL